MEKFENEVEVEDMSDVMIFPCLLIIPKLLSKDEFLTLLEIKSKKTK